MSGHSKWSQIKRQKELNDKRKGATYTKLSKQIVLAARNAGPDVEINFMLKMAVLKAKMSNMPLDNIKKAINRGAGIDKQESIYENISYGLYLGNGSSAIVDVITDNRHRSAADIRMIIERNGGQFVEPSAVSWQFQSLGLLKIPIETAAESNSKSIKKWNDKEVLKKLSLELKMQENFEIQLLDLSGIVDFEIDDQFIIYTEVAELDKVRKTIEGWGFIVDEFMLIKRPKEYITLSEQERNRSDELVNLLYENDDVDNIWTNYI